jgi:glycosyltransferase involved in cell wall biosynthesis
MTVRPIGSAGARLTVGMPVYNGERYMAETIDTILGQDVDGLELMVSDNCSTDATAEIVKDVMSRDDRVRYVRNEHNVGAARNYNQLVEFSQAPLFKWAGYDDLLRPSYLARCLEVLDAQPDVVIAYPRTTIIDGDGNVLREQDDKLHLRQPDPVERVRAFTRDFTLCNPCFGVIRRDVLQRTSLVQPYVSSDVPLLVELALLGQWHEVPERLFDRRIHDTSSRQGKVTMRDVAQWFDPDKSRPIAPRTRVVYESLRAIERADLPAPVRRKAAAVFLSTLTARRASVRGGAAKQAARETWRDRQAARAEVNG